MSKILKYFLGVALFLGCNVHARDQVDLVLLTRKAFDERPTYDTEFRLTPWGFALPPPGVENNEYDVEAFDSLGFVNLGTLNEASAYLGLKKSDGKDFVSIYSSFTRDSFFLPSTSLDLMSQNKENELSFSLIDLFGVRLIESNWPLLLQKFNDFKVLVLPFSGYDFSDESVHFPDSLKSLTVYNSILGKDFFSSLANAQGLEELILYGCSLSEDASSELTPEKIHRFPNLKHLTIFSCASDLKKLMLSHSTYPNLLRLKFSSYSWGLRLDRPITEREQFVGLRFPALKEISFYPLDNGSPNLEAKMRAYFLRDIEKH